MTPEKDVTVVIPVYNRRDLIVRTLDSVYAQTRRPARVVVVDNDSTDDTLAVATQWAELHRSDAFRVDVISEPRRGAWAARNRGLGEVDTQWVSFFDSDDTMRPCLMEKAAEFPDGADIIMWKMVRHKNGHGARSRFSKRNLVRRQVCNSVLGTQRYMVRTDFIRRVGGWGCMNVWQDWELGLRMLGHSPVVQGIPEVLVDAYAQEDSITGTSFSAKQGQWEHVVDEVCDFFDSKRGILDWDGYSTGRLKGMMDYVRVILAAQYAREKRSDLGRALLENTLKRSSAGWIRKQLLRFIYHYTRMGGRMAYVLWR